jgi:hypothetical protein
VIDQLESKFREAGLVYAFDKLELKDADFLPEPAALCDGVLYRVRSGPTQDQVLASACAAIATQVYKDLTEERENQWKLALFYPTATSSNLIRQALIAGTSFQQAVESLSSPVTRLVAIHCFNALIRSGMSFEDAKNVDLSKWGSTADLATGKRPCSLLPLLGAYAPVRLYSYFPDAVTALVMNGLNQITYSEVRSKFSEVVKAVFNG